MLIPLEVLESDMNASGFSHRIPVSEQAFIGGLDCRYDDAPLGYYRYHYWINSDTPKSHENYIFVGKNAGCICVSLIQEKDTSFRILFRSSFGWKALLLDAQEFDLDKKLSMRTAVLKEAMKVICTELFPDQSNEIEAELSSPLNMGQININTFDDVEKDHAANVSRNSSLSSIKSSFTLSALRSSFAGSQESISSFTRFGSMASLSEVSPIIESDGLHFDEQKIAVIIEELSQKFFKSAYKVKDTNFAISLLELEKPLTPKYFNFDVINASESETETFKNFNQILGQEISKKENINYVTILGEKYKAIEVLSSSTAKKLEKLSLEGQKVNNVNSSKLGYIVDEFIETEKNYMEHLCHIEKIFINHFKNDDSGKFILKIKEFKDIFDGITEFIPIHQKFMDNLQRSKDISNFIDSISELVESRSLYCYQTYFTTYEKRMSVLKNSLEINTKFAQYHEQCVSSKPELNKKGLDQLFIFPIQRMPRYVLLLREILKYVSEPSSLDRLQNLTEEIGKVVQFLNLAKHKSEQTEMMFMMQRKINNFPPDFLRAERSFISKIACFMVDPLEGKVTKIRITIYLCNDLLIFAKKKNKVSGIISHDFLLAVNIKHVQVNSSRSKKGDKIYFNTEIDVEKACFTHNISDLDSTLLSHKKNSNNSKIDEDGTVSSCFQFCPKNQKKVLNFLNEFSEAKNQNILSESPAKLIFKQQDKYDVFFHVYEDANQIQKDCRSPIAVIYVEDEVNILSLSDFMTDYDTVVIVQGRCNTLRFFLGTKISKLDDTNCQVYSSEPELLDVHTFSKAFFRAILNAHLFMSIYPPLPKTVIQQRQFVLESALAASKSSNLSSIGKGSGLKGFFSGLTSGPDKSGMDRLSRGSSLKTGTSPLSSPLKASNTGRVEALKKEINIESSMSHLHL